VRKMTGLDWKSDSAATVIHPFLKGNGRIHLNGTSGVKLKNPDRIFDPGFLLKCSRVKATKAAIKSPSRLHRSNENLRCVSSRTK